jgi:hypothetical protein
MVLEPIELIPIKRYRLGKMQSYEILVGDFDRIENEALGIGTDLAFATACIPVGVTLSVTLFTVTIANPLVKDPFLVLMFTCYILGAYFGLRAYRQRGRLRSFMQAIRDGQVAPLGEKGSEISRSELETLPSEEQSGSEEK